MSLAFLQGLALGLFIGINLGLFIMISFHLGKTADNNNPPRSGDAPGERAV